MSFPCGEISSLAFIASVSDWLTFSFPVTANINIHPVFPMHNSNYQIFFDKKYKFVHSQVAINGRIYGVLLQKSRTLDYNSLRGEVRTTDEKGLARQSLAIRGSAAASLAFAVLIISHPAEKLCSINWSLSSHGLLPSVCELLCLKWLQQDSLILGFLRKQTPFCSSKPLCTVKRGWIFLNLLLHTGESHSVTVNTYFHTKRHRLQGKTNFSTEQTCT